MEPSRTHKILSVTIVTIVGVLLAGIFVAGYLTLLRYIDEGTTNDEMVVNNMVATTSEEQLKTSGLGEEERYAALSAPLDPVIDAAAQGATSSMEFTERQALLEAVVEEETGAGEMLSDDERLRLLTAPVDKSYE